MALNSKGYPVAGMSTNVPNPANSTEEAAYASFMEYNHQETEVISIAKSRTPFMHTLINLGRDANDKRFKDFGLAEGLTKNFPDIRWKERDTFNDMFKANGAKSASDTTLVLSSTTGLYGGLVVRNVTTNEQMRITSVSSSTDIVVQRGIGTVAAAAITVGDMFQVLGSAAVKGQASMDSFDMENQERFNYIQKFLTSFTNEDFDQLANTVGDVGRIVTEKNIQHALEIEKAALFGQKKKSTVGGKDYFTMEGVIQNCTRGWTHDISSTLSRTTLEESLEQPLKFSKDGSFTKLVLCGTGVRSSISALFEGRLQVDSIEDVNLKFSSLQINQGKFIFVEHPMLDASTGYGGTMLITDPSYMRVIYPTGQNNITKAGYNGKTRMEIIGNESNFASTKASLVTYLSMEIANSNAFGAIKVK